MSNILVVAAHPDDEALGCAGTIAKHVKNGDKVFPLFIADGVNSRDGDENALSTREVAAKNAQKHLGTQPPTFLNFQDSRLDTVALLEIVKIIEAQVEKIRPTRILTHWFNDLNVDHEIVCKAVHTATRPMPRQSVIEILCFEVLSSTEWNFCSTELFQPNYFVEITETFNDKMSALKSYEMEMRPFPNARSFEGVEALAKLRGVTVGVPFAEAFVMTRSLRSGDLV